MVLSIFYQISWVGIETFTYKGKDYKVSDRIHRLAKLIITIYSVMIGVGTIFGYYISLILGVTSFWQLFLIIIGIKKAKNGTDAWGNALPVLRFWAYLDLGLTQIVH